MNYKVFQCSARLQIVILVRRVSYCLLFTLFYPAGLPWRNEADLSHLCMLVSTEHGVEWVH